MNELNPELTNTFALIVTYAERGDFVCNLSSIFLSLGLKKVIIVDNGSLPASKTVISRHAAEHPGRINVLEMSGNVGTAIAFKAGMECANADPECSFIWILDDDNIPDNGALDELFSLWNRTEMEQKSFMLMLSSYRKTKPVYRRAVIQHSPDMIIGHRNHFRAFHLAHLLKGCARKRGSILFFNENNIPEFGDISASPYGGMFFHKNLFRTIGYPDPRFYIYSDDHEFSHRLILRGGRILLALKSTITDIEDSWNAKGLGVFNIAYHKNKTLLYYSIRNRVYLELRFTVNNYITYFVNAMIYTAAVMILTASRFEFCNLAAFLRGVWDGLRGKMGVRNTYKL